MIARPRVPMRYKNASIADFDNIPELTGIGKKESCFLTGGVGTGKTHLAAAILREWAKKMPNVGYYSTTHDNWECVFISVPELLGCVQGTFGTKSTEYTLNTFQLSKCLVLDDLGAEKMSEWSFSCLYRIISGRDAGMLPTIVTSNLSLSEIDEWEPRIASRLSGWHVIKMGGKDRRTGKAAE